jgi:hypothetical protein
MPSARHPLFLAVVSGALCLAGVVSGKPKKGDADLVSLGAVEVKVTRLLKSKDLRADYEAFASWLQLPSSCAGAACDAVTGIRWASGNLDDDPEDEKILAITTRGSGACAPATVDVIAFDPAGGGAWAVSGSARLDVAGAKTADLTLQPVHASNLKDLVVNVEGPCGSNEHVMRVYTLEHAHLEELAASDDVVGKGLVSFAIAGPTPAGIELGAAKGPVKLKYDAGHGYDALPSYESVKKDVVSASDDKALNKNECAEPMGAQLALDCLLNGAARIDVMVQNGKAVGVTVSTTPVNRYFGHCARKKLAQASWKSVAAASGCTRTFAVK